MDINDSPRQQALIQIFDKRPSSRTRTALAAVAGLVIMSTAAPAFAADPPGGNKLAGAATAGMGALDKTLDKVGATTDQKTKIKAIIFDAVMSMGAQGPALKATAAAFGQSLMAPHVDRAALEGARVSAVADFDAFSKVLVRAIGDSAEVLTPDQRAKLAASVKPKS